MFKRLFFLVVRLFSRSLTFCIAEITKFIDGEVEIESLKDVFTAGVSNGGSLRIFRNELYCQVIKQTMHNPSKHHPHPYSRSPNYN